MPRLFERRLITEHLRQHLEGELAPHLVGVADLPDGAGWSGQPRADGSNFRPYTVLTPLTISSSSGTIGTNQSEWQVPYALASYGAAGAQAEWIADRARAAIVSLADTAFAVGQLPGGMDYAHCQQVWVSTIGSLTPSNDTIQPKFWAQSDTVVLWLTALPEGVTP